MKLHDWIYEIVSEVCYDRDYLYACYVRHFTGLMNEIIEKGPFEKAGAYTIEGIKSNKKAFLCWHLDKRLDWLGPNKVTFCCEIKSDVEPVNTLNECFDLSTGEIDSIAEKNKGSI